MFVYGKSGRKNPYAIKLLTQMQLAQVVLTQSLVSDKKVRSIVIKSLTLGLFADSPNN